MAGNDRSDQFDDAETKRRAEAALKRMLNTPPKPHAAQRKRKPSRRKTATRTPKKLA